MKAERTGRDLIAVSIQLEYDPDDLATKITTPLVLKRNSETLNLCVVIFVGQIVFNLNTTPDAILRNTDTSVKPHTKSGLLHPGGNPGPNLKSISHRCYLREVAFVWELTKETIVLPLGCLQGGPAPVQGLHTPSAISGPTSEIASPAPPTRS